MECVEWEGTAEQRDVVGCGTVEWNVLSERVERNREMQWAAVQLSGMC